MMKNCNWPNRISDFLHSNYKTGQVQKEDCLNPKKSSHYHLMALNRNRIKRQAAVKAVKIEKKIILVPLFSSLLGGIVTDL